MLLLMAHTTTNAMIYGVIKLMLVQRFQSLTFEYIYILKNLFLIISLQAFKHVFKHFKRNWW